MPSRYFCGFEIVKLMPCRKSSLIDSKVMEKIRIGMIEEHETEKWYGDLSDLHEYINKKKN